jgi:vacuolar protein sorting-associated protein 26
MAGYFFGTPIDVEIKLDGAEQRKQVEVKMEKERAVICPVYYDGDSVSGQASFRITARSATTC